jgi:Dyp-type peroxidase family
MRTELIVKSKTLGGVTDLTLLAPLKKGLVPALDAVTYKTRVKRLLKTLSLGRASSHEYGLIRPFSDAVERVGKIHSVRVAVVEPDQVLLAVTFDGSWESYLRVLWQKVGTLLDVIFCNTEGYVSAYDSSFEAWAGWVRSVQIETDFFYGVPRLTVDDVHYLRGEEQLHRAGPGLPQTDLAATQAAVQSAEARAWDLARRQSPGAVAETVRMALQSLSVIHRLTHLYVPSEDDGKFLHRAARDLLLEFVRLKEETSLVDALVELGRGRFDEPLTWLLRPPRPGSPKSPPVQAGVPHRVRTDVQAGILNPLERNTHGALLFFAFDSGAAMARFLDRLALSRDADPAPDDGIYRSAAFTLEGLRQAGLGEAELEWFPLEFREGMEARASMLGDFWHNHPRRWRLPASWAPAAPGQDPRRIELASVHLVVQLRVNSSADITLALTSAEHPLRGEIAALSGVAGAVLLAAEPMSRAYEPAPNLAGVEQVREHFGFVDGMSNPGFAAADEGEVYDNRIPLGEVLLGHANQADPMPAATWTPAQRAVLHNGSFLVVRKLRQDTSALHNAIRLALDGPLAGKGLDREAVLAKMMGRRRDGLPLAGGGVTAGPPYSNDFDYAGDAQGRRCPFHAHVRRANPRPLNDIDLPVPEGGRFPRLMRRGMSYSEAPTPATGEGERGLMFMAYSASIAEQFEVVQRWLAGGNSAGGNSAGGFSGQGDPFVGVAQPGQRRHFRFEHADQACAMPLDGDPTPLAPVRPFVQLEWGAYLFVPSLSAVAEMSARAAARPAAAPAVWDASRGLRQLEQLEAMGQYLTQAEQIDAWKAALEDPEARERFRSADLWAAIRQHRQGVLRTAYGVLVCDAALVKQAFARSGGDFSVSGYYQRMAASLGEIFLGLDDSGKDCPYRAQSGPANEAIAGITGVQAFDAAFGLANARLDLMVGQERALSDATGRQPWELNLNLKEIVDPVIEGLCKAWFGLPEKAPSEFEAGPARWDCTPADPPRCPGHFTAPSRYFFQPQPNATVQDYGRRYGRELTAAMTAVVTRWRQSGHTPGATVAQAIFNMPNASAELIARTMVGAMMGFIPTLDGALRLVLNEWLLAGDFWALRDRWEAAHVAESGVAPGAGSTPATLSAQAATRSALIKAMQLRPMPELVWRTVARPCQLGSLALAPGERVVLSIVSATQQALADGDDDVYAMFGGDRHLAPHSHACPGYEAAMGALLGAATALLRSPWPMRPSPAPLALTLGPVPALPPPAPPAGSLRTAKPPSALEPPPPSPHTDTATRPVLLAEGDSWFDHWSQPGMSNLLEPMSTVHGFQIEEVATAGDTLRLMSLPAQLDEVALHMRRLHGRGITPQAILLSAGGNDLVAKLPAPSKDVVLLALLNERVEGKSDAPNGLNALNEVKAQEFIDTLAPLLRKVLRRLDAERQRYFGPKPPPIVLHGYDYPIPDGRGSLGKLGNWLWPSFDKMKWGDVAFAEERGAAMKRLIVMLNKMQTSVLGEFQNVHHVDLCGTLEREFPKDYKAAWANELHPTAAGYVALAQELDTALKRLLPAGSPSQAGGDPKRSASQARSANTE